MPNLETYSDNNKSLFKEIVEYAKIQQIIVEPDAIIKMNQENYKNIIDKATEEKNYMLTKEYVLKYLMEKENVLPVNFDKEQKTTKIVEIKKTKNIYAKDIDPIIKINHESEITDKETNTGKIAEFYDYFRERFTTLGNIIKKRPRISPITSSELVKKPKKEEVILIGMLYEKRKTKKGNIFLVFDDLDGYFKAIITSQDPILFDIGNNIINDDVVALRGTKLDNDIIIVSEVIYPDLPNRTTKKAKRDISAIAISDIHLGSKLFFEKYFQKFIDWLNLKGLNEKEAEEVSKIKYMFVAGDSVDGIGVYPQQMSELNIIDIYEQYERLADFFEQIPEYIHIFIGPGNHDAVRRADPQPAIPKEFTKRLYDLNNVYMLSSPINFEVENLNVLMYHGNSMNSLQFLLNIDHTKPELAMKEYLKRRDLSSFYGERQPVVPEKGGYLLVKEEPDIFITGHLHSNAYDFYKGTLLVNPGTWQAQTIFQREQGHIPTPGRVPIIKLNKGKIKEKVFIDDSVIRSTN